MQIDRLFSIVYILLNEKNITAVQLAQRFEVSSRTIYRDMEILNKVGIPIYSNRGRGGGFSLLERFVLNKSVLSEKEQDDILSGLQSLDTAQPAFFHNTLSKLRLFFNRENLDWIQVDYSDWNPQSSVLFNMLRDSILKKEVIRFVYFDSKGERHSREVEPLQLRFKSKNWYLWAFCRERQAERLFKLSRIQKPVLTGHLFNHRARNPIKTPAENTWGPPVTLTLRIEAPLAYRVYDEFTEEQIQANSDGSFTVTPTYPDGEWIYGYLLSFGPLAEVLAPEQVRQNLSDLIRQTSSRYN